MSFGLPDQESENTRSYTKASKYMIRFEDIYIESVLLCPNQQNNSAFSILFLIYGLLTWNQNFESLYLKTWLFPLQNLSSPTVFKQSQWNFVPGILRHIRKR